MDIAEYRRHAHHLVDWMADYLETVESWPVRSGVEPGEIEALDERLLAALNDSGRLYLTRTGSVASA